MRIHNYLEDALGTKVKIRVLRELFKYPTKPYTIRELSGAIRVTHTGVRKALGDLRGSNLITIEHHGQSNLIKLNRDSFLRGTFSAIFQQEIYEAFEKLKDELKKGIPNSVDAAAIFGSFASGREKPESDIDIIFIADDKERIMSYLELKSKVIFEQFGNTISPYFFTRREFIKNKASDVVKNILSRNIKLHGEELWSLIQQM